jgi:hypothetical protein
MMPAPQSIFLDYHLPNATTWFYCSALLAVALFFKFTRLLSVRNWDVVSLFLLVPGLLLLQEAHSVTSPVSLSMESDKRLLWFGYLWLMLGSCYFLVRCLVDLTLERRPALQPNLNPSGLAWLAGALFICLVTVAIRRQEEVPQTVGKGPAALEQAQHQLEVLVDNRTNAAEAMPGFDTQFWVRCALAIVCHLAVVSGLVFIGYRHFQDTHAGMAAATFYLLLPYTALHVEQVHHVLPSALLIWAVAAYRRPLLAGLLLGLAAGAVYFPALVFPLWLSFYWRRGVGRFATGFLLAAGFSLAVTGTVLLFQGELGHSLRTISALSDWQPWKTPTTEGFWLWIHGTGVHWAYRIPVFIAYLAFLITTAFWPAPKNLAHVLALSAAVLIGIQFWYADRGGVYVLWYLPLLLLLVFRPNLADRRPPLIVPETDWLFRLGRSSSRAAVWLMRGPEPLARVR